MNNQINDLSPLIAAEKARIFNDPATACDLETLGIMVSKHCDWEIDGIAKVIFAALEDSNYHTLNERVTAVIEAFCVELEAMSMPEGLKVSTT